MNNIARFVKIAGTLGGLLGGLSLILSGQPEVGSTIVAASLGSAGVLEQKQ